MTEETELRPVVSIIISAYNVAPYIEATVRSALAQDYRDTEIIVVDDGSTDETGLVLEQFSARGLLRVLHRKNGGSAAARNFGAQSARGKYLAFLDGDDVALPARLARAVEIMEARPDTALVYGDITLIDEMGESIGVRKFPSRYREGFIADALKYRNFIPFSTITVRRSAFEALGGFDLTIRSSEDWEFLIRLARRYPVAFAGQCLVAYRIRRTSKTMDVAAKEAAFAAVQTQIFSVTGNGRIPRLAHACRNACLAGIHFTKGEWLRAMSRVIRAILWHPGFVFLFRAEIGDRLYSTARRFSGRTEALQRTASN